MTFSLGPGDGFDLTRHLQDDGSRLPPRYRLWWNGHDLVLLGWQRSVIRFFTSFVVPNKSSIALGVQPSFSSWDVILSVLKQIPWPFVLFGLSVIFVSAAYSLPPLRLSANALGELCVSYVLTFVTPTVGLLIQDGRFTYDFWLTLLPLFIVNASRMIVMNIPDRDGDSKGNKVSFY